MHTNKYTDYYISLMQKIEQSGYHGMPTEQQRVVQAMSINTHLSFLDSIYLVRERLCNGWSLDTIKEVYHLENIPLGVGTN